MIEIIKKGCWLIWSHPVFLVSFVFKLNMIGSILNSAGFSAPQELGLRDD